MKAVVICRFRISAMKPTRMMKTTILTRKMRGDESRKGSIRVAIERAARKRMRRPFEPARTKNALSWQTLGGKGQLQL
jgi:hypothetical protein